MHRLYFFLANSTFQFAATWVIILTIFFVWAFFLCSCASYQLAGQRIKPYRSGIVSYEITDFNLLTNRNRQAALGGARKFCSGDFTVVHEEIRPKLVGYQKLEAVVVRIVASIPVVLPFNYVTFNCTSTTETNQE